MATSKIDAAIDALKSTWDADGKLGGAPSVLVVDGPAKLPFDTYPEQVLIGHDGSTGEGDTPAADANQEFVGIGTNSRRDERIDITCAVIVQRPDDDMGSCRGRAYALVDACEAAVIADHTLGVGTAGTPGAIRNAIVSTGALHQSNDAAGVRARVVFTVSCIARL